MQKTLSLVLTLMLSNSVLAQSDDSADTVKPGAVSADLINIERQLGEPKQISERQRYFWQMRGLELGKVAKQAFDFSEQRKVEVDKLQDSARDRATGSWTDLGPSGIAMRGPNKFIVPPNVTWDISPVSGRVSAFAQSPASTSTLLVGGASGGLWRSTNGGVSWNSVFDTQGTQSIGSIWYEPGNASRVWVGTGERNNACVDYFGQGLYLSTNGGVDFNQRNGGGTLSLSHITSISTSPAATPVVLVAGTSFCNAGSQQSGGIFRSENSGGSWTKVAQGAAEDVIFLRSNAQIAYAGITGNGVLKSIDAGKTWVRLASGLPTAGVSSASAGVVNSVGTVRVATVPYDSNMLFALVRFTFQSGNQFLTRTDLFATSNAGASWSLRKADVCDGQCDYNVTIDVDPIKPNDASKPVIAVGFVRPWLSTDGGSSFNPLTDTWSSSQKVHQDIHAVRFARIAVGPAPAISPLWIGGDGGLWRTDNRGSIFTNLNNGLSMTQFYDIAVHPSTLNAVYGGTQDNSSIGRFGSNRWDVSVVNGDGGTALVDSAKPNIVFQFGITRNGLPDMYRSDQNAAPDTMQRVSNSGIVANEPFPFVPEGANSAGFVFVGSSSVYRASSNLAGASMSWTKIANNLTQGAPISVITPVGKLATDPLTLYVGSTWGGIFRLFNVTATNTPPSANVTNNFPGGVVTDIAVDTNNPTRVFVTRGSFGGSKLYYSGDQAASWTARGTGLPNVPANSVAIDPADGAKVFVATDVGVFRSFDGGVNFQPYDTGMPLGAVAVDLEIQASTRKLYVATYGRGVFVIDL